jgi:hypothetical protein
VAAHILRAEAILLISVALTACEGSAPPPATSADSALHENPQVSLPPPPRDSLVLLPAQFGGRRDFDFDGDGIAETIYVRGTGPAWDSMDLNLEIRARDKLLYADSFSTRRYTGLDPDPTLTREQIAREVYSQLQSLLSDDAFRPTAQNFDDPNVSLRRQYEEHVWKQRHSTSLYEVPEDSAIERKIRTLGIREEEYADFERDVMSRPMYRYYVGGESSVGITWSAVVRLFVETWICC